MNKKMRGLTLIELLIVVAIIGILAALLIPNALEAIQKAKQKSGMKEITTIATAMADYMTDHGDFVTLDQNGPLEAGNAFMTAISSFYVKVVPINDPWSNPYQVHTGTGVSTLIASASGTEIGDDDFAIASFGRDKAEGPVGGAQYSTTTPEGARYNVSSMTDFNNDLVNWNGSWIAAPATAAVGAAT